MNVIQLDKNCFLDFERDIVVKGRLEIPLSRLQIHVLRRLSLSLGQPVSREDIIKAVWGSNADPLISMDELYVVIHRIRTRIEGRNKDSKFIISIRGLGYLLRAKVEN